MKTFKDYWTFLSIRGALTLVAAAGMLTIGPFASALMSVNFIAGLAVDVFAIYVLLDCGAMLLLEMELPGAKRQKWNLVGRVAVSLTMGTLLFAILTERLSLSLLPWVLLVQLGAGAVAEFRIALKTRAERNELLCFAPGLALAGSAALMPLLRWLEPEQMVLALSGCVGLYGTTQLLVGGRMLFEEYRLGHPVAVQSAAWQGMMEAAPALCGACEACPALEMCSDTTVVGQLAQVKAARVPVIVRAVRSLQVAEGC